MLNKAELQKWLERQSRDVTENGAIEKFILYHTVSGAGNEKVETFPASEQTVEDFVSILDSTTRNDAATHVGGMPERYQLVAVREGDPDGSAYFAWLVEPINRVSMGESSDPPTPVGERAQSMRHQEQLHKLLVTQQAVTLGNLVDENNRERTKRLEAEAELEMYIQRERDSNGPVNALAGMLTQVLPVLLAQFLQTPAPKAVGAAPSVMSLQAPPTGVQGIEYEALLKLIDELSPAELMGASSSVTQAHQLAVFEIKKGLDEKASPDLLKVAAFNLMGDLSQPEFEGIIGAMTPEHAQVFVEIYKAMAKGRT